MTQWHVQASFEANDGGPQYHAAAEAATVNDGVQECYATIERVAGVKSPKLVRLVASYLPRPQG